MTRGDRVEIGFVARAHGIHGEIVVGLHNPDSTALAAAAQLFVGGDAYTVESVRHGNHGPLVALAGVADRTAAEQLKGRPIAVERALVAEDDDILLEELVGFAVHLTDGTSWGTVVGLELGAQDRLVIHDDHVERLLPIVDELIAEIDAAQETITVTPPESWPSTPLAKVGHSPPSDGRSPSHYERRRSGK
jgi:16S rRNA processing protein RimM